MSPSAFFHVISCRVGPVGLVTLALAMAFTVASSPAARSSGGASPTTAEVPRTGLLVLRHGDRPGPGDTRPASEPQSRWLGVSQSLGPRGKQVAGAGSKGFWSAQRMCPCTDPRAVLRGPSAWSARARDPRGTCRSRIHLRTSQVNNIVQ